MYEGDLRTGVGTSVYMCRVTIMQYGGLQSNRTVHLDIEENAQTYQIGLAASNSTD